MSRKFLHMPSFVSKSERTINTVKHSDSSILVLMKDKKNFRWNSSNSGGILSRFWPNSLTFVWEIKNRNCCPV